MHIRAVSAYTVLMLASYTCAALVAAPARLESALVDVLWKGKCLVARQRPMRVGVEVAIQENDKGRGLYAMRDLPAGTLVGRYEGVIMSDDDYQNSDSSGVYAMGLANGKIVDGEDVQCSNFLRYINHSKRRANCQAVDAFNEDFAIAAVYLETIRGITAGEELLFDCALHCLESLPALHGTSAILPCMPLLADGEEYWDTRMPRLSLSRLVVDYF